MPFPKHNASNCNCTLTFLVCTVLFSQYLFFLEYALYTRWSIQNTLKIYEPLVTVSYKQTEWNLRWEHFKICARKCGHGRHSSSHDCGYNEKNQKFEMTRTIFFSQRKMIVVVINHTKHLNDTFRNRNDHIRCSPYAATTPWYLPKLKISLAEVITSPHFNSILLFEYLKAKQYTSTLQSISHLKVTTIRFIASCML